MGRGVEFLNLRAFFFLPRQQRKRHASAQNKKILTSWAPPPLGGGGKKSPSAVDVDAEILGAFFPKVASNLSAAAAATSGSSAASHLRPTSTASGSPSLCTACSARSTRRDLYLPASAAARVAAAALAAARAEASASSLARRTLRRDSLTCLERSLERMKKRIEAEERESVCVRERERERTNE